MVRQKQGIHESGVRPLPSLPKDLRFFLFQGLHAGAEVRQLRLGSPGHLPGKVHPGESVRLRQSQKFRAVGAKHQHRRSSERILVVVRHDEQVHPFLQLALERLGEAEEIFLRQMPQMGLQKIRP